MPEDVAQAMAGWRDLAGANYRLFDAGTAAVRLVTGHQSDAMLSVYTRPRSLFESSAGAFFEAETPT